MRLLIVSHTPHYSDARNGIVGWGPTIVEIDHLGKLFEQVTHIAPLHAGEAPRNALPYQSENIYFRPVQPAGGEKVGDKVSVLGQLPKYWRAIRQLSAQADVVQVRCPANISLAAVAYFIFHSTPRYRWFKYAGNWRPLDPGAFSYTLQRLALNMNLPRGVVTVNGSWPGQRSHIYSFTNPSLKEEDIQQGMELFNQKPLTSPYRLLFAGRVERAKGVVQLLQIAQGLKQRGIPFQLDLVGDGPERGEFEQLVSATGLGENVAFRGWLPKTGLPQYYKKAHFFVFPTASEGWPKVLSEAMAYGAVPLAGAVSSIPQVLDETGAGVALPPHDVPAFIQAIVDYIDHPDRWLAASQAGIRVAPAFTYDAYLRAVRDMFKHAWGITL